MSGERSLMLEAVADVARAAGDVALRYFKTALAVEQKSDGSPVTIADRSAEQCARDWIEKRFPADGILGEEFGAVRPDARRRWIMDPIDGTKSFVRGVPLWGTLIAVCEGDDVLAGAAYFPAVGDMLAAAVGEGCWWNGTRARVSAVTSIEESLVLTTDPRFRASPQYRDGWLQLSGRAKSVRTWGDCYGYLLVATGRAEVMVDPRLFDWDAAALLPAIVEAGGVFTSYDGCVTAFARNAIATNAAVAVEARLLLGAGAP